MGAPSERIYHRLAVAAEAEPVGRRRERAQLRDWLRPNLGPAVVSVSGAGGIGKSVLVRSVVGSVGRPALTVDGHDAEPTPTGMLTAIGQALGRGPLASPEEAADVVADAGVEVLVVDAYERLNLVDGWLRNDLLVQLPASLTTVLVGRRPPNVAWRTSPGWRTLLAELLVGPLDEADATRLLDGYPLPAAVRQTVLQFSRGHPLALRLAAEALIRHPGLDLPGGPPAEVVEELFDVLLGDLSPTDRAIVEAAAVLRRVTQPLLAAVLGDVGAAPADVEAAWRHLRSLPFVTTTTSGLRLHPVAHHTISDALEIRDPDRVRQLRRRAAAAVVRAAASGDSWEATADLLFLVQNPVIRNAYVPPGDLQHPVERASEDDLPAILAITEAFDGPAGAATIRQWWTAHREHFVVGRDHEGSVNAFSLVVRLSEVDRGLAHSDPVLRDVLDDVRRRPVADGEDCLLHRRALGVRRGELQTPEYGAMIVDIKRQYLELRPVLARTYAVTGLWAELKGLLRSMGFAPVPPGVPVGEPGRLVCVLEFGPGHVDGWLWRHILVETGGVVDAVDEADAGGILDQPPSPLASLSAREREVLTVLAEGLTNTQIAERLFISERTANRHLSNIFTKLGVGNRTAAARIALQAGLVS